MIRVSAERQRREGFQNPLTHDGGVLDPETEGTERGDGKVQILQPGKRVVPRAVRSRDEPWRYR